MQRIEISLTAQTIPENIQADISIIIDVLRASSVIVTALANYTTYILPTSSIEDARSLGLVHPDALLTGERGGIKIPGFHRGNSPLEHQDSSCQNPLILTTTNGTLAIQRSLSSQELIVACFLNVDAVFERIRSKKYNTIHIACAGTDGQFSLDDFLMAGALISRFDQTQIQLDDLSIMAGQIYHSSSKDLHGALSKTSHYKKLLGLGLKDDLNFCLRENIFPIVPELSGKNPNKITVRQII